MRKSLKILHSLASCGLIGGLASYMILLVFAPQDTPVAYADLRQSIAAISDYVLVPSLALALVSGLLSMAVHRPYQDKGWALVKLALGILMFKGVLTIVGGKAAYAASVSRRLAEGEPVADVLQAAIGHEWATLWVIMALSVANVVLGVWRPKLSRRPRYQAQSTSEPARVRIVATGGERAVPASEATPLAAEMETIGEGQRLKQAAQ
ncbi:DUF2269 family protein [Afifella pfennigii]|uniref:DUF2269 family protein n=1 Tax=Afifella pfennigii TaxID=209897 RepID=UPI00146F9804|nr:DUF2269 family protein [Afifella pfennigii]